MRRTGTYLLIVLLALPLAGQGQVLCIGMDGHVALESAFNGKCCDGPQPARSGGWPVVSGSLADFSDCGLCADILIGGTANADRMARLQNGAPPTPLVPIAAIFVRVPGTSLVPASHPPRQAAHQNTPLAHLRTVTLLV